MMVLDIEGWQRFMNISLFVSFGILLPFYFFQSPREVIDILLISHSRQDVSIIGITIKSFIDSILCNILDV